MKSNKSIFFLIILLESCSSLGLKDIAPNYFEAYSAIKGSILGFEDYPISRKLVENIPYASLRLKIGKGSAGLLILEEIKGKELTYVSADNVRVVIKEGKVIRTSGLGNNLVKIKESKRSFTDFLNSEKLEISYYSYRNYDEPVLIDLKTKVTLKKLGKEEIMILGVKYNLNKFQENIENSYLGWKVTNQYWADPKDNFVWKSEQSVSPLLPVIKYEVTKKPTF